MRRPFAIAALSLILIFGGTISAQKSQQEILADQEFEAGRKLRDDGVANAWSVVWDATKEKYRAAIEHFVKARDLYRQAGNRLFEAHSVATVAQLQKLIEQRADAIKNFEEAIRIFAELGQRLEVAKKTGEIGDTYFAAKDYYNAIRYYNDALAISREVKNSYQEGQTLTMLGQCYSGLFNRPKALEYWEAAAKIHESAGKGMEEAMALELIGRAYRESGERQKAVTYYDRIFTLYEKQPGEMARRKESETIEAIADLFAELGDFPRAIDMLKRGIEFDRMIGIKESEAQKLATLAMAYHNLRDSRNGQRYLEESLALYRSLNDRSGEASVLMHFSSFYLYDGNSPQKALEFAEKALALTKEIKDVDGQANVLKRLSDIATYIPEKKSQAPEFMKQALELYRSLNDTRSVADALQETGVAYVFAGDDNKATDYFNEALMTYVVLGLTAKVTGPLYWLQQTWRRRDNAKLATAYGKQGIGALQTQRSLISTFDVESQRTYLASVESNYRALVRLLFDQGRVREAHQALTAFKDAQSLDVADAVDDKRRALLTFTPRENEFWRNFIAIGREIIAAKRQTEDLRQRVAGRQPTSQEAQDIQAADNVLSAAWKKYFDFVNGVVDGFAQTAGENDQVPAITENMAIWNAVTDVSAQTKQTTVAVYQMVSGDGIDLLIVTPDEMQHVRVEADGLNDRARKFWGLLQSDKYDPRPLGKELFDLIFKPIEKYLPAGTKTIVWSTDGNLRYIPMAALYDGKQYVVERYNNVTFTRADGDRLTRPVSPKWNATAFGSSKAHSVTVGGNTIAFNALPGVGAELDSIFGSRGVNILNGDVAIDASFTRDRLLATLKQKRPVVHIASHFSFRPGDDQRSFLLLGDGTAFTLADMKKQKDMFAGVELLTLSACNTAAQQPDANGREVDAFFELAQRLGAQSVLATLWPVADNSTPWLMRKFYELKVRKNETKAEALRNAQLSLLNGSAKPARSATRADASRLKIVIVPDGTTRTDTRADEFVIEKKDAVPYKTDPRRPFAHPFYWSAFVLVGNWR